MNKNLLPYDIYERHKQIAKFIDPGDSVLDVGGELNHLSQFVTPKKIIVANLDTGDIIIKKDRLPFKKGTFDVVCAIDVLEHIPKNERQKFVHSIASIAVKKVLLSFPIGTADHVRYEEKMQIYLKKKLMNVRYLTEHIKYGLPTKSEIDNLFTDYRSQQYFSGNLKLNEVLFKIFIFDPKIKYLRKLTYLLKLLFNLITNPLLYLLLTKKPYSSKINRAYLIIFK